MRWSVLVALIAVPLVLACAKGREPAEPRMPVAEEPPYDEKEAAAPVSSAEAVASLESLADRMCDCKDQRCVGVVMDALVREAERLVTNNVTGTHQEWTRAGGASEKAATCFLERGGDQAQLDELASVATRLQPRLAEAIASSANAHQGSDEAVELERLADQICGCEDTACLAEPFDAFIAFVKELQAKNATGSEANIQRAGEAAEKAVNCYQKLGGDPQKLLDLANAVN